MAKTERLGENCTYLNEVGTAHLVLRFPDSFVGRIRRTSPHDDAVELVPGVWARSVDCDRFELMRVEGGAPDGVKAIARGTFTAAAMPDAVMATTALTFDALGAEMERTRLAEDDPLFSYAVDLRVLTHAVQLELSSRFRAIDVFPTLWLALPTDGQTEFSLHLTDGYLRSRRVVDVVEHWVGLKGVAASLEPCGGCGGPHRRAQVPAKLASIGLDGAAVTAVAHAVAMAEEPPF